RRPLALYINHDDSVATHVFPGQIMSSALVQQLLSQFIMWSWDMTEKENEVKLIEWLCESSLFDALSIVTSFLEKIDDFPLLILFSKSEGQLKMVDHVNGNESPEQTMEKLIMCMDDFASSKLTMGDNGETTANDNAGGDGNGEYIQLKVIGQDANEVNFRVKYGTYMGRLKKSYANRLGISDSAVKFTFDGRRINDNDTPRSLKLKEEDVIEAHQST
ncbi:hypothetical protein PENTCL1PPCAC_1515, partial [Pristionchus entomophagus]